MLKSMTGFGHSCLEGEGWVQTWEVRSVNSRHLDIKWKLPAFLRCLEPVFEKECRAIATRCRLDVYLSLQLSEVYEQKALLNVSRANAMLNALSAFAASRGDAYTPAYQSFLQIPALWDEEAAQPDDGMAQALQKGLRRALHDWNRSRTGEGKILDEDLRLRVKQMEHWTEQIASRAPQIKQERFDQVRNRVTEMLKQLQAGLDEHRFLQEIVLIADKLDVSEELTRLKAHFLRLNSLLDQGVDAGRKLDFTLQECFREVTTCGNKIQDAALSHLVVDLKNELEKCREQVQNIE